MTNIVKIYQIHNTINGETLYFIEIAVGNRTYAIGNGFNACETPNFCKNLILQINRDLRVSKHTLPTTKLILRC
jgi:hypothetical protein